MSLQDNQKIYLYCSIETWEFIRYTLHDLNVSLSIRIVISMLDQASARRGLISCMRFVDRCAGLMHASRVITLTSTVPVIFANPIPIIRGNYLTVRASRWTRLVIIKRGFTSNGELLKLPHVTFVIIVDTENRD